MAPTDEELIVDAELRLGGPIKGDYWWFPLHPPGGASTPDEFIWHLVHQSGLKWGLCWVSFIGQARQKSTPPYDKLCRQCVRTYAMAKPVLF